MYDTVIRNGHVIDPMNNTDQVCDIAIKDGKIAAIGHAIAKCDVEYDATDLYVVPGLVDCHVHCYQYCTTLGVNPDETCLSRGTFFPPLLTYMVIFQ